MDGVGVAPLPAAGVPGLYAPPLLGVGLSKKSLKIQNSLMGVESGSSRWSSLKPRAECGGVLWRDRKVHEWTSPCGHAKGNACRRGTYKFCCSTTPSIYSAPTTVSSASIGFFGISFA